MVKVVKRSQVASLRIFMIMCLSLFSSFQEIDACSVLNSNGQPQGALNDPLFNLLQLSEHCPQNVVELRRRLKSEGATFVTTMVANQGFHNPNLGSFSFFEMVEIKEPAHLSHPVEKNAFFFGHFTAPGLGDSLTLDQRPLTSSLMIELIAWDDSKELYNFYELIGSSGGPHWFYRGDSSDVWADIEKLHLVKDAGEPPFGNRLRCSGCHLAGGPIMKELVEPHDSWWRSDRHLPLGGRIPDPLMSDVMRTLQDPGALSTEVTQGVKKLFASKAFKARQASSPQVALRPLFCPEELNLEASPLVDNGRDINPPSGFFLDKRLALDRRLSVQTQFYKNALQAFGSRLGDSDIGGDADHAWMTPVKAQADILAVTTLVSQGFVDNEFMTDVLALDMTRPVFSQKRCRLLTLVPRKWSGDWQKAFINNLEKSSWPEAKELFSNLTQADRSTEFHKREAHAYLEHCTQELASENGAKDLVGYLGQIRSDIRASEISQNPNGEIMEPGFRLIFPAFNLKPKPWAVQLRADCKTTKR